jgi:DnaJ family protein C protein 2
MLSISLPAPPSDWDGKKLFESFSSPAVFSTINIEPHGSSYFSRAFNHLATPVSGSSSSAADSSQDDAKYAEYKDLKRVDLGDYYGLLGLKAQQYDSSVEEIKAAWRVLQRVCHPDKSLPEERELAEARFKAMQQGYEILTDPARRRGYDSSLPFDERIPSIKEGANEKDFFRVYGPVFERNERFSIIRPVPKLGTMDSSDEFVQEFYSFWTGFESWREFADLNEAKPENAGCREEKRKLERENKKKQEARKKEEMKRVFQLTDEAMKKDPRMKRMRERADAAKNAKKNAKLEAAKAAEEAKRKEDEEKKRAAEESAAAEKASKENEKNRKQALKSIRSYFGKYAKGAGFKDEEVTKLRESLTYEQFEPIVNEFKADPESDKGKEMVKKLLDGDTAGAAKVAEEAKAAQEQRAAEEKYKAKKEEEMKAQAKAS